MNTQNTTQHLKGTSDIYHNIKFKYIMLSQRSQTQRLCTIGFHVHDILKKAKFEGQKTDQRLLGTEGGVGLTMR